MPTSWRLILQPDLPGYRQMAIDEALYTTLTAESPPVVRFYSWDKPTLSLGYFQDYKRVVSEAFCVHNKIDVVRRITGGRSVLHHVEVTYAVVASLKNVFANQSLQETYQLIARVLNLGLERLGVQQSAISLDSLDRESGLPQCFVAVSRYEISRRSRKIIGSAQKRSRDRFLQHGSILLGFDPGLQRGCVNQPDPSLEKKIAPLNLLLNRRLTFREVTDHFASAFQESLDVNLQPSGLEPQEARICSELEEKYLSQEWTRNRCK